MKNSRLLVLLFGTVAATWSFEACNDASQNKSDDSVEVAKDANDSSNIIAVDEKDAEFAMKAANGGMAEVEIGKVGQEKAVNASVKDFANMMVMDHTKANDELKALAATKNITLPATIGEDNQEAVTKLTQKDAKSFDKDFIDKMIDDHEKMIDLFKKQSSDGKDADLKAFADKMLPSLNSHLEAAKSTKDNLKK